MGQAKKETMELRVMEKGRMDPLAIKTNFVPNYGGFQTRSEEKQQTTETMTTPPSAPSESKSSVARNLLLLVIGTTCMYSSVNANMGIISSVASDSGQGFIALLVYAIVQMINSLVGNHYMAKWSSQRVLLLAMVALTAYNFLSVYISWATLTLAAVFQGVGYSLQWIAGNTYTTELGLHCARLFETDEQVTLVRMFGLFNFAVQGGFVWGNLAVDLILDQGSDENKSSFATRNQTVVTEDLGVNDCRLCGAVFRSEYSSLLPQLERPPESRLYLLEGVFGALSVVGAIMIACLDNFGQSKDLEERPAMTSCKGFWDPVKQMALQLKDIRQILLLPISVVIGMEQAFIMGEYTVSYVSCCMGIHSIGLVMVCFGAVDIVVCVLQEWVVRVVGRIAVIGTGLSAGTAALLCMLFWHPTTHDKAFYYIIAVLWSFFDAILITQVFSLYGLLFQDKSEVNFSVGIACVALGFLLQFSYSIVFSTGIKISILLAIVLTSAIAYGYLEYSLRSKKAKKSDPHPTANGIDTSVKIATIECSIP